MTPSRNDLIRLLKFSLSHDCVDAMHTYPMFSPRQVYELYEIGIRGRRLLLARRQTTAGSQQSCCLRHQPPAHVLKMRQIAADSSNR